MWQVLSPAQSQTVLIPSLSLRDKAPSPSLPFLLPFSSSSSALLAVRSAVRCGFTRPSPQLCRLCSKLNLTADQLSVSCSSTVEVLASEDDAGAEKNMNETLADGEHCHSRTFLDAESGEELLSRIQKEANSGRLPANVASGMEELYQNYRYAVLVSKTPDADDIILTNMSTVLDRILVDVEEPFQFAAHHRAVRDPFDYYMLGQNYIRPLIDFRNSYVGNASLFSQMEDMLMQGHNIVFISNHQTEADPAIIALLLEKQNSQIAENMICVAGDRVLTDPLCKPFSIGRNLLCVYSKKHMYDVPELVDMKKRANTRSLKEMALLLRGGSQIIWIAPSGGRDRPDPYTKDWYPAPFDVSSVDNMRRLVEHASVPGHIFPLALLCYDIMPPPLEVEKEIGEKRIISFHGAGLSVAPEINYSDLAVGVNEEEAKKLYTQALYDSVLEQYKVLQAAIHGKQGLLASSPSVSLSQPWS
ncbi:Glycerol-3-phosphate acyltransferase ATS12, chloroplastic [Dionaea muscipula]